MPYKQGGVSGVGDCDCANPFSATGTCKSVSTAERSACGRFVATWYDGTCDLAALNVANPLGTMPMCSNMMGPSMYNVDPAAGHL
eukprot:gene12056-55915_t